MESKFTLKNWVELVNTSSKLARVRCLLSPMDVQCALAIDGDKKLNNTSLASAWLLHTYYDGALALFDPKASMMRYMQMHAWSPERINSYKKLCNDYASKSKDTEKKSIDELIKIAIHYLHPELWPHTRSKKSSASSSTSSTPSSASSSAAGERMSSIILKAIARFEEKSKNEGLSGDEKKILEKYMAKLVLVKAEEAEEDDKKALSAHE